MRSHMKKTNFLFILVISAVAFAVSCNTPPVSRSAEKEEPVHRDTTPPELRVTFSPQYFSPDGDKEELAIYLFAIDDSQIGKWKVEIIEPQPPYQLFYQWEGQGAPPDVIMWNGKNFNGELVQSASDYPFIFTASDIYGNTGRIESLIEVDVIVLREGNNLRIQIPSIVFSSNSGHWDDLDADIIENNIWIIKRVAQILAKFNDYKVWIEGHANPTVDPGDRARYQREQTLELQPLSEARAKRILDELVMIGIDSNRLKSYGLGGAQPIVPWEDKDSWWKNRRVEFILIK